MPNFNNSLFLNDCLKSIFAQTFQDFSLIIVDDCSTDDSIEIIKKFNDVRINLIERKKNGGIVSALNDGLKVIDSEYIVRHDGDDLMHPERLKTLVEYMDRNPQIGVCSSDIKMFGAFEKELIFERDPQKNKSNLIFGHSIGHASSIFRTKIFTENKIRYSNEFLYLEDYNLFYDLKDLTDTTSIPNILYYYRVQTRHNNEYQINLKRETFKSFYKRVFYDLEIPIDDTLLELHFQIAKHTNLTFEIEQYIEHIHTIRRQNSLKKVFPEKELNDLLNEKSKSIIYRKIDSGKIGLYKIIVYSLYFKHSFFRYWLSNKMRRKKND